MVKNKDRWSTLPIKERASLISIYVKNGITNLSSIKGHYNKFENGGNTDGKKGNSNILLGPVLKIANAILGFDGISNTQRDRLLEFAMRISGGNTDLESATKALKYVYSRYGRRALLKVLSTDTPVSDIVDKSIESSGYTVGDNYGGVAFSNDFWDSDDFIFNNAESADFVDAYVKGTTPYENAGVVKVSSENPGRLGRYSRYIEKHYPNRNISTYQAYKDTLNADLVRHLDEASTSLKTSTFGANTDKGNYQEAFPFGSEGNRGFFDAAGYNIELVKGPDGKIYGRKSDMYDFLPSDFNTKWAKNSQLHNLVETVDSMGHPFIFRTPWFEATKENVPEEILLEYTEQNKKSLGGKINKFDMGGSTAKPIEDKTTESNKYITKDNYLTELAKFRLAFEEFHPQAYKDTYNNQSIWTLGTGLTYIFDDNGNEVKVKEGDTITEEENLKQLTLRIKKAEDYARSKTSHWDNYHPELKFQILDAMFNAGNSTVWNKSPNYQAALRRYETAQGWNDPNYNLKDIFQHADWNLSDPKWLGLRSRMRRNPQSINPEDYNLIYLNHYRDSLRTAYDEKFRKY